MKISLCCLCLLVLTSLLPHTEAGPASTRKPKVLSHGQSFFCATCKLLRSPTRNWLDLCRKTLCTPKL